MFVAKYVFIDEHIALSMFPHQKCIWITNFKKKKEYSFWTYSFKGWFMSDQGMSGIKKAACGQTNPHVSEVFIHDSKISGVLWCKGKHNLLQWILNITLRCALRSKKFKNSGNLRNLRNPLILLLVCLSFHNNGTRPSSCLLTVYIYTPTFLSNAHLLLITIYEVSYIIFGNITLLSHALFWQAVYGQNYSVAKSYFQWHQA